MLGASPGFPLKTRTLSSMKARTAGDAPNRATSFCRPSSFWRWRAATCSGPFSVGAGSVANHEMSDFSAATSG